MLTSVYYYNFYRPYILKDDNRQKITAPKVFEREKAGFTENNKEQSFVLNKALKKDVVEYANQLSYTINNVKNSARDVARDVHQFQSDIRKNGFDAAKKLLADDLSQFVDAYNAATEFSQANSHSQSLSLYTDHLKADVFANERSLSRYSITVSDEGLLSFDAGAFAEKKTKRMLRANDANQGFFQHTYDMTGDFLIMPLSTHMNFKNLGYYYNYKLGSVQADTFKIIESGMVFDKVV